MDQCAAWHLFCNTDAAVSGSSGVAAAQICLPRRTASSSPPPPSSPSSTLPACLADPRPAACASYAYPDADAARDLEALCGTSSLSSPACAAWQACQGGAGGIGAASSAAACRSFPALAAVCGGNNTTSGVSPLAALACRSYAALCGTVGTSVLQCGATQ